MNRRAMMKTGGMAMLGLGLGGCAPRTSRVVTPTASPYRDLPPVHAAWDRVIRTTVGLRPHRRSGFVVRAERLDDKTLVHNYGHGGAGMSTSWGTAYQAAELAMQDDARRVAVLGCGVVGLTTARQLQRRGFDVTIYAKSVPPNTTSNMSWAGFTPTSGLLGPGGRTPAWTLQFQQAADIGYKQLQVLVGPRYGVAWINRYSGMNEVREPNPARAREDGTSGLLPADLQTGRVILQPGEHPFPTRYASCQPWLRIEPSIYLDALVSDVLMFGGRIVIRTFDTQRDLMALGEPIVVNCTGLGARDIFDDDELLPLKGQLTHFVPQPEVDYGAAAPATIGPDGERQRGVSTNPRSDGIAPAARRSETCGRWKSTRRRGGASSKAPLRCSPRGVAALATFARRRESPCRPLRWQFRGWRRSSAKSHRGKTRGLWGWARARAGLHASLTADPRSLSASLNPRSQFSRRPPHANESTSLLVQHGGARCPSRGQAIWR